MLNAAGGGAQASHGQDDAYRAVISIEHVQNGLRPIERRSQGKLRRKHRPAGPRVPPTSSCLTMFLPAT